MKRYIVLSALLILGLTAAFTVADAEGTGDHPPDTTCPDTNYKSGDNNPPPEECEEPPTTTDEEPPTTTEPPDGTTTTVTGPDKNPDEDKSPPDTNEQPPEQELIPPQVETSCPEFTEPVPGHPGMCGVAGSG